MSEATDSPRSGANAAYVDEPGHLGIGARFGDDDAAVGVADQDHRAVLRGEDELRGRYVARQGQGRILDDAHGVAVFPQDLVDSVPAGPVHEATVYKSDIHRTGCGHGRSPSL
jgi:hypothetical protein